MSAMSPGNAVGEGSLSLRSLSQRLSPVGRVSGMPAAAARIEGLRRGRLSVPKRSWADIQKAGNLQLYSSFLKLRSIFSCGYFFCASVYMLFDQLSSRS